MQKMSIAHLVGWVVVLAIVSGVGAAQALPGTSTVDSGDILDGQVKRADVAGNAVTGAKVADGTITGADVANGGLGAADMSFKSLGTDQLADRSVNADVLGVDAVRGYHVANGSLTGLDLAQNNSLTGGHVATDSITGADVNEQSLNLSGNCGPGTVHGWARISAYTLVEDTMYTIGGYNCAGGPIRVYMEWPGIYRVYFDSNPSAYGIASMEYQSDAFNNTISMYRDSGSSYFTVRVTDASTAVLEGGGTFVVMLF